MVWNKNSYHCLFFKAFPSAYDCYCSSILLACFFLGLSLFLFVSLFVFVLLCCFVCFVLFLIHAVCFFFSSASPEESSPRVKPKFHKTDTKFRDSNNNNSRLADPTPDTSRKFSRPIMKFPKSKDKVNVWTRQKNVQVKRRERVSCWLVVFIFCCGVSKEHQWYSLLGKGKHGELS